MTLDSVENQLSKKTKEELIKILDKVISANPDMEKYLDTGKPLSEE